jgi:hypothetical protein
MTFGVVTFLRPKERSDSHPSAHCSHLGAMYHYMVQQFWQVNCILYLKVPSKDTAVFVHLTSET